MSTLDPMSIPLALAVLLCHGAVHADDVIIERVLIEASRTGEPGLADAAGAGTLSRRQLDMRTAYRPGEILEAVPGLVVGQHSGEGKANQFYLRGFNLDHGTDLRTTLDDMPLNQRSHAHGQGWTDLNFLIPELVGRLDYKKGPYSSTEGDFASAGSAAITYVNRLAHDVAGIAVGQDGYARTLVAGSPALDKGNVLYALELLHNDGPSTRGDDYRKVNGVLRYSEGYANNGWSATAMAYRAQWHASDQIPARAVASGALGRFDTIDPSDGGTARRYSLSALWRRSTSDAASKLHVYLIDNQLALFSNFTYYMNDPVNGDQFGQPDRRVSGGVHASQAWHGHGGATEHDIVVGAQLQNDNIFNALNRTRARTVLSNTRADHIVETSLGVYVEEHARWNAMWRTVAGLRADQYRFAVRGVQPDNGRLSGGEGGVERGGEGGVESGEKYGGTTREHLLSPSLSLIFGPWPTTALYFNIGNGFHSNDARGAVATIDPKSGQAAERAPALVRSRGIELGLRTAIVATLQTCLSLYRLDFDSELAFAGDTGSTEAGRPSRRTGVELSNRYQPVTWLSIDVDLAYARARSRDSAPGKAIPGAVEGVGQLALSVDRRGPWSGALQLRYLGPRPLVADDSVRAKAGMMLNGRLAYKIGKTTRVELEGFNLANRRDSAIDYYYASQLKDESAPHNDIHFHPAAPRSARLALLTNW